MKKHAKSKPRPGARPGRPSSPTSLYGWRVRKEAALTKIRERELARLEGRSLDRDEVRRTWGEILRMVRAGVMAAPSRVRSRLPHLTAEDVRVIDAEIRQVLTALADGAGSSAGTAPDLETPDAAPRQ